MPKEGKKLDILSNLNDFVDKLLVRMADESVDGRKKFLDLLEAANKKYNDPKASWITGWIYLYTRQRGPDLELAKESISKFTDAYTRLQEFKILISKGEWETGSLNTFILLGLISSIEGYEALKKRDTETVVAKVREMILDKIDAFMKDYKNNQKLIENKKQELLTTQHSEQALYDKILLATNLETAKVSAISHPKQIQFCILKEMTKEKENPANQEKVPHNQKSKWNIYWLDVTGKEHLLSLNKELIGQLEHHNGFINPVYVKPLKKQCLMARDAYLERIALQINPQRTVKVDGKEITDNLKNEHLIAQGLYPTFILRGNSPDYTLSWINTREQVKEIPLSEYPLLHAWLNAQHQLTAEELPQLKSYLSSIKVANPMHTTDDFKQALTDCFLGKPKKPKEHAPATKLNMNAFTEVSKHFGLLSQSIAPQEHAPRKKLDMTLFAEVSKNFNATVSSRIPAGADVATIAMASSEINQADSEVKKIPVPPKPPLIKSKLNLSQFNAVSHLFKPSTEQAAAADSAQAAATELPSIGIMTQNG